MAIAVCDFASRKFDDQVDTVLNTLRFRVGRSVVKHGTWDNYDATQVFDKVMDEVDEYREALVAGVVVGRHGQIDELIDVAVTAVKGVRRLVALEAGDGEDGKE